MTKQNIIHSPLPFKNYSIRRIRSFLYRLNSHPSTRKKNIHSILLNSLRSISSFYFIPFNSILYCFNVSTFPFEIWRQITIKLRKMDNINTRQRQRQRQIENKIFFNSPMSHFQYSRLRILKLKKTSQVMEVEIK